jgi:TRAP-type C4-dicarboxylate transport system substrate-binding protein
MICNSRTLSGLLALLLPWVAAGAFGTTLKIATVAPDGTTWMNEIRAGAAKIESLTEGRVQFKFYPGGVMGNAASVMRKMRVGQLQGGAFTGSPLSSFHPDAEIYSLPFLFTSFEEVDYVRERLDPVVKANLEANGLVVLGIAEGGFATLFSQVPIRSLDDARGRKTWVGENDLLGRILVEKVKATPVLLPLADVYTALQTGMVDTVPGTPTAVLAFQWHTKLGYMTDVPLSYVVGYFGVAKRAFDAIDPKDQAIVRQVFAEVFKRLSRLNREDNEQAREALKANGMVFVVPTAAELSIWREVAKTAIEKFREAGRVNEPTLEIVHRQIREYRDGKQSANGR